MSPDFIIPGHYYVPGLYYSFISALISGLVRCFYLHMAAGQNAWTFSLQKGIINMNEVVLE